MSLTEFQEQELISNVKSLTDRMTMVDAILSKAKLGIETVLVFMCGESGLFFPGDYIRNWGRPWGDGLGPDPVSECLQTDYHLLPPPIDRNITSIEQIMHPLRHTRCQVDAHMVDARSFENGDAMWAIPMADDASMRKRVGIIYEKQLMNPRSKISRFQGMSITKASWMIQREGGFR